MDVHRLRQLARQGEGQTIEFKKKANHPDKIARELVAFANSEGGTLLIGVDDEGNIHGCKSASGDWFILEKYFENHCVPRLPLKVEKVPINAHRQVLAIHVKAGYRKPYFHREGGPETKKVAYVRSADMSLVASREMVRLLRHDNSRKGVSIRFGNYERSLLQYLEKLPKISLEETAKLLQVPKRTASNLLVVLVRAGLLQINPSRQGDFFTLAEEAFLE